MIFRELGKDIWIVDGPQIIGFGGFHYPTRMVLVRLNDGGLWVHSPVALSVELAATIEELGPAKYLIAPNNLHHMALPEWAHNHPQAHIHAAPGVARKQPGLTIAATLGNTPAQDWDGEIDQVMVTGNLITTEIVFFHRKSQTVIFTDLLQNLPQDWFSGWRGWIARHDLMIGDQPKVPRKFRVAFSSRRSARRAVGRVLEWPTKRVVMAHGSVVENDGQAFLRATFGWLMKGAVAE